MVQCSHQVIFVKRKPHLLTMLSFSMQSLVSKFYLFFFSGSQDAIGCYLSTNDTHDQQITGALDASDCSQICFTRGFAYASLVGGDAIPVKSSLKDNVIIDRCQLHLHPVLRGVWNGSQRLMSPSTELCCPGLQSVE